VKIVVQILAGVQPVVVIVVGILAGPGEEHWDRRAQAGVLTGGGPPDL
jgi:hypothetical protein